MLPTKYGSFLKRFVAHLIDALLASTIAGLVMLPFFLLTIPGLAIWASGLEHLAYRGPEEVIPELFRNLPLHLPILVGTITGYTVIYWLYFALFESSRRQATPGKMAFGLFVTDTEGRRLSFWQALLRTVCKVLSKLICYVGYLLALFTDRNQALHDLLAGTLVLEPDYLAIGRTYGPPAGTPPPAVPPGS